MKTIELSKDGGVFASNDEGFFIPNIELDESAASDVTPAEEVVPGLIEAGYVPEGELMLALVVRLGIGA